MRATWPSFIPFLSLVAVVSQGAVTPFGTPMPEGEVTEIECQYFLPRRKRPLWYDEGAAPGVYAYSVRIPDGYNSNARCYPCLFVTSGGLRGGTVTLPERVEVEGWLVVTLLGGRERGGYSKGNLVAAYADAFRRLRIQKSFLFAVGGAEAADAAGMRVAFRGMICRSPRLSDLFVNRTARNEKRRFAAYFAVNAREQVQGRRAGENRSVSVYLAQKLLPRVRYRVDAGSEGALSGEVMADAFDWLERGIWLEGPADRRRPDMYLW